MVYRLLYNKLVFSQRRRNHSYSYMNLIVSLANLNGPPLQEHKLGKAWLDRGQDVPDVFRKTTSTKTKTNTMKNKPYLVFTYSSLKKSLILPHKYHLQTFPP